MILKLIIHLRALLSSVFKMPRVIPSGIGTFIERVKSGYYKMPHFKHVIHFHSDFGQGKGLCGMHVLHKYLGKYGKTCDFRVLSNITLNLQEFPTLIEGKSYRHFSNIDDIDWLMEDGENGKPAFDAGIIIIDELSSVMGNRDFMNSKKGKGIITKNFSGFMHQLRKRNTLVITMSQDDAFDITMKRRMELVHVPHSYFFNRFNVVKVYRARDLFNFLEDANAPMPEIVDKYCFFVPKKYFNSYDTKELVKQIGEGDYFRPNDKDAPAHIVNEATTVSGSSVPAAPKSFSQKLLGNKKL